MVEALLQRIPGRTDHEHVRTREFQLGALRFRSEHSLAGLARRLKRAVDAGEDTYSAFMECQDHAVAAAAAHVEWLVLDRFSGSADRVREPRLPEVLARLGDLYALSRIERDRGWFLEHGFLSPGRSKAVVKLVGELCAELRPLAADLVDAFGIPDALLAAPIAT